MKVMIVFEDIEGTDGEIDTQLVFDPPVTEQTEATVAVVTALDCYNLITAYLDKIEAGNIF